MLYVVGIGGLVVTCSSRDPRFAGSNPANVDGFFSARQNSEYKSSAGGPDSEISGSLKNLKSENIGL